MPTLRDFLYPSMETPTTVLEINLISAQDLLPTYKPLSIIKKTQLPQQTYVVAWIDPNQKLTSRIDTTGNNNPTWNDKFIFPLNNNGDTDFGSLNSTLVFEIYSVRRGRYANKDKRIGLVSVLLHDLIGSIRGCSPSFKAFHVRTSLGDPHGILNVGLMSLDGFFLHQDMPSFIGSNLAIDYRKLMGAY